MNVVYSSYYYVKFYSNHTNLMILAILATNIIWITTMYIIFFCALSCCHHYMVIYDYNVVL